MKRQEKAERETECIQMEMPTWIHLCMYLFGTYSTEFSYFPFVVKSVLLTRRIEVTDLYICEMEKWGVVVVAKLHCFISI